MRFAPIKTKRTSQPKRSVCMMKTRVLFICTHNSARSPMAEAWLRELGGEAFEVESAGLEPGALKSSVVEAMREVNIDLSRKTTQTVFDVFKAGRRFDYVIMLCDEKKAERCPVFPGMTKRLHWDIPERPKTPITKEEQLAHVRGVRDLLREQIQAWVSENPDD
jgi:arsenate reductase